MKQITIIGPNGLVGKNLVQKAILSGMKVKTCVQDKRSLQNTTEALEVIEGDYFDIKTLQNVLDGSEAVLSTITPPKNVQLSSEEEDKYINSLAYIIKQMKANKQRRWISLSSAGVKMAQENLPMARKLLRVKLMSASRSTLNINERELKLLAQTDLDWTTVRPPIIKEKVEGIFDSDELKFISNSVDVNQLCDFILNAITSDKWLKKAPVVGTK